MAVQARIDTAALWAEYGQADAETRSATDAAMSAALDAIRGAGLKVAYDDRAAELEAVIFGFIRASNE